MNTCTFVDIQGFRGNDESFIIKEIAYYKSGVLFTYLFAPPYNYTLLENKFRKQAAWLFLNHHKLRWNEGYISYSCVKDIIYKELAIKNSKNNIIYVKGDEKVKWLQEYCDVPSVNIESLRNCPNLKLMEIYPMKINLNNISLAQKNVLKLFGWYNKNYYKNQNELHFRRSSSSSEESSI